MGWDKDDCWFAHCCMLNSAERKMFADNGLGIAHCPSANLRLVSGIAPVRPATLQARTARGSHVHDLAISVLSASAHALMVWQPL